MDPSYAVGYLNGYWIKFIFKGARHCAQLQSTLQRRVGRHAVSSRRALNSCFGGQPRAAQKLELCSRPHAGRCTVPPVVIVPQIMKSAGGEDWDYIQGLSSAPHLPSAEPPAL